MKRNNLYLAIAAIMILLVGSLIFGGLSFLRGVAGLLFVLVLPGFAITAVFFPGREFGFPERLALAIGFSIALAIISGLLLHLTPWGLQTGLWILLLAGITVLAWMLAWVRKRSVHADVVPRPSRLNFVQIGLIGLALLLVGLSIAISRQPTPAAGFEGYTSLWIFPVQIDDGYAIQSGLSSMEFETVSYRLELQKDGEVIGEYPEITLAPGESTQFVTPLGQDQVGGSPVEALLYRLDNPGEPYRQVTWWPGDERE